MKKSIFAKKKAGSETSSSQNFNDFCKDNDARLALKYPFLSKSQLKFKLKQIWKEKHQKRKGGKDGYGYFDSPQAFHIPVCIRDGRKKPETFKRLSSPKKREQLAKKCVLIYDEEESFGSSESARSNEDIDFKIERNKLNKCFKTNQRKSSSSANGGNASLTGKTAVADSTIPVTVDTSVDSDISVDSEEWRGCIMNYQEGPNASTDEDENEDENQQTNKQDNSKGNITMETSSGNLSYRKETSLLEESTLSPVRKNGVPARMRNGFEADEIDLSGEDNCIKTHGLVKIIQCHTPSPHSKTSKDEKKLKDEEMREDENEDDFILNTSYEESEPITEETSSKMEFSPKEKDTGVLKMIKKEKGSQEMRGKTTSRHEIMGKDTEEVKEKETSTLETKVKSLKRGNLKIIKKVWPESGVDGESEMQTDSGFLTDMFNKSYKAKQLSVHKVSRHLFQTNEKEKKSLKEFFADQAEDLFN